MDGSNASVSASLLAPQRRELAGLLHGAAVGVHRISLAAGTVQWANAAQLELLGYARDDYVGRAVVDLHADRADGGLVLESLRRGEVLRGRPTGLRHRDGSVRDVLLSSTAAECPALPGRADGVFCSVRDVTGPNRVQRRLSVENAVVRALAESTSLREATPEILRAVCQTTGWSWGALWCVEGDEDDDVPAMRCIEFWGRPDMPVPDFESATRRLTVRRGVGLPGGVWASGRPAWVIDVAVRADLPRRDAAAGDGVHGAIAFPVPGRGGEVLGAMEFFSRHPREPDPDLLDMMGAVGGQLGQYIERRRGEQALASSDACNAAIVRAALDCIISVDHRDRVLAWNPAAEVTFGHTRAEAVGRGLAELILPPPLREAHRLGLARHVLKPASPTVGRRLETRAVRKDGSEFPAEVTVTPIACVGPPRFTVYLRDLSERRRAEETTASLRAVLQQLLVARDIQESILPRSVPCLPGIQVAGIVRASAQCSGDFYDYLTTPSGATAVALGDASGHGVGPALVAAETATCLRTLARTYDGVDHLLTAANAILAGATPPETFVTMILVSIDPATRSLTYANAGHPSGLIVGGGGRVKAELASMDLPMAVCADVVFERGGPVTLVPGDLVVLVSDGLLEAWSPDGEAFGARRLREAVCGLQPESAAVVVERLYATVRAFTRWAPQHDDMSAVAIKVVGG